MLTFHDAAINGSSFNKNKVFAVQPDQTFEIIDESSATDATNISSRIGGNEPHGTNSVHSEQGENVYPGPNIYGNLSLLQYATELRIAENTDEPAPVEMPPRAVDASGTDGLEVLQEECILSKSEALDILAPLPKRQTKKPHGGMGFMAETKCNFCDATFTSVCAMYGHLAHHAGEREWSCSVGGCGEAFTSLGKLQLHQGGHHTHREHHCDHCQRSFHRQYMLDYHVKRVHSGEKTATCAICSKKFFGASDLRAHLCVHLGIKMCVCEVCGKQFTHVSNLNRHRRMHTGVKPYVCEICKKRFAQVSALDNHKLTAHSSSEHSLYKCHKCSRKYRCELTRSKHLLNKHNIQHTNILQVGVPNKARKYYCIVCGKTFLQREDQRMHERSHFVSGAVNCPECGARCGSAKQFRAHSCQENKSRRIHSNDAVYIVLARDQHTSNQQEVITEASGDIQNGAVCSEPTQNSLINTILCPRFCNSPELPSLVHNSDFQNIFANSVEDETSPLEQNTAEDTEIHSRKNPEISFSAKIDKFNCDTCHVSFSKESNYLYHVRKKHTAKKKRCNPDHVSRTIDLVSRGLESMYRTDIEGHAPSVDTTKFMNEILNTPEMSSACHIPDFGDHSELLKYFGLQNEDVYENLFTKPDETTEEPTDESPEVKKANKNGETRLKISKKEKGNRRFRCMLCSKQFKSGSLLEQHAEVHDQQSYKYKCSLCSTTFNTKTSYIAHLKSNHDVQEKDVREVHECSICHKEYNTTAAVQTHYRRDHLLERGFGCELCNKTFFKAHDLKVHRRTHTKEKPYMCGWCGRGFADLGHMKRHERIHTGEKPHRCDICSKSFNQSTSLTQHKKRCLRKSVKTEYTDGTVDAELVETSESVDAPRVITLTEIVKPSRPSHTDHGYSFNLSNVGTFRDVS